MLKRLVVFAHWDKDAIIDDYVVYYLKELAAVADVIFVSDTELIQGEINKISSLVIHAIAERHGEYDFGSYKRGLAYCEEILSKYDELIFANDSCYGPLTELDSVLPQIESRPCDFWGMTQYKYEGLWHIQSYFVGFKKQIFTSKEFKDFIYAVKKQDKKIDIIKTYEIGLTQFLIKQGFEYETLCPPSDDIEIYRIKTFNLTRKYNFPFIKKELMVENKFGGGYLYDAVNMCIEDIGSSFKISLIEDNLDRTAPIDHLDGWFHPELISFNIGHRKFIRVVEKKRKYFTLLSVRLFSAQVFLIPFRFYFQRCQYEKYRYGKNK